MLKITIRNIFYENLPNLTPPLTTGNNGGISDYPSYGGSRGYVLCFPVVLDLDGEKVNGEAREATLGCGVELVSKDNSHAWFDTTGDGTLHKTGWVGADDGLLVIDENSEEVNCEARETTLGCGNITTLEMAFASRTTAEDTDLQALANNLNFKNTRRVA